MDYTENNATVRATNDNILSNTLTPTPNTVTKTEPDSMETRYKSEHGLISPIHDPIYDASTDTSTATHDSVSDIHNLNLSDYDDAAHPATEVTVNDTPTPGQRPHIKQKIRQFRPSPPHGSPPTKRFIPTRTTRQKPLTTRRKPSKPLRFRPIPPRGSPTTPPQTQNTDYTGMIKTLIENFTSAITQSNAALNQRFDEQRTANELRFLQMNQTLINNSGPLTAMLTPSLFSGDSSESVKQFLRSFNTYANHLGWTQEKCLHTIPALLTKSAACWWDNLTSREKPDTFDDFCHLLTNRYYTEAKKFRAQRVFKQLFQNQNESDNSYWERITQYADEHYIDDHDILTQFLGGLLTEIKTKVLTFDPETPTIAHHKAQFAEEIVKFTTETTTDINNSTKLHQTIQQDTFCSTASNTSVSPRTSRQTPARRPRHDSVSSSSSDIYESSNNSYEQDSSSTTANTRTFEDQDGIVLH